MANELRAAAHPPRRRLRRRRLGQDHRDHGARQRARRRRLGVGRGQHGHRAAGRRWASARWRGSAPRISPPRTTRSWSRTPPRSSSPARPSSSGSARSSPSRSWAAGRSSSGPARSTTRSTREEEAFARARRFLSYLPSSIDDAAAARPADRRPASAARSGSSTRSRATSARPTACARSSRRWSTRARSSRSRRSTAARSSPGLPASTAGRWPSGERPDFYGGAWTADTCQKVERFVDTAQTFHLPVVYLVDCPGFLIGLEAEQTGTIKQGVRAMSAIWQTTVPWCAVIIRNAFGVAGAAHKTGGALRPALRVAVGPLGLAAARGRHRGGLPRRHRRGARSGRQDDRDRGAAATSSARRSARPRPSGSRRSSTRATPARCSASSPSWPRRCAKWVRPPIACGRRRRRHHGVPGLRSHRQDRDRHRRQQRHRPRHGGGDGARGRRGLHLGHQRGQERARRSRACTRSGERPSRSAAT